MPKMKTHSGAKKRFTVTGSGKIGHAKEGKRHLLSRKKQDRIRRLRQKGYLKDQIARNAKVLLPYA